MLLFDESDAADSSACCSEPAGLNTVFPGISGAGGGRTGAVVLSRYIRGGTVSTAAYNHYSLLRSVEDIFGVSHLGTRLSKGCGHSAPMSSPLSVDGTFPTSRGINAISSTLR